MDPLYDSILDNETPHFRLLTLYPGILNDPIVCTLSSYPQVDHPPYEALSYVWGDPTTNQFCIQCNGHEVNVGHNLFLALLHLRGFESTPRTLWIDALCINQSDMTERSAQVQIMGDIYRDAAKTIVWLGEADEAAQITIGLCHNMMDSENALNELARRPKIIEALLKFFNRPWFSRAWIIQELILSREDPVIMAGLHTAPWEGINRIVEQIGREVDEAKTRQADGDTRIVYLVYQLARSDGFVAAFALKKKRQAIDQSHPDADFLDILVEFRNSVSTDPRDKIYSLLGLTQEELGIVPDYSMSVNRCYADVTFGLLQSSNSLRVFETLPIFHRHRDPDLSSWVPQWNSAARRDEGVSDKFASTMESYLRFQEPNHNGEANSYRASGESTISRLEQAYPVLRLDGMLVDCITEAADALPFPKSIHDRLAEDQGKSWVPGVVSLVATGAIALGEISDTLAAWRRLAIDNAPVTYPTGEDSTRAFLAMTNPPDADLEEAAAQLAIAQATRERQTGGIFGAIGNVVGTLSTVSRHAVMGARQMVETMYGWNEQHAGVDLPRCYERRLARTAGGYMGIFPPMIEVGDYVVLLAGGKKPFVVRGKGERWQIVSGCFIYGMMNGEKWDENDVGPLEFV